MNSTFAKWFWRIYLLAAIINTAVWLWCRFPWGLVVIAVAALMRLRTVIQQQRQRQNDGYWLEFLSAGVLRGDDNQFAVVYHEGEKQHFFQGRKSNGSAPDILTVPSQLVWRLQTPQWMAERRELILERIQRELEQRKKGRQMRIVEEDKE
ncbi:hypothetical protein CCAX7_59860 [Capsulimonas corticalis]|uniref:Uncharacterized protein n=1 Tax=Capsulimonas corticalis TaxID=2219043 RepID=A0A402CZJ9_9BACT|nr:hypothetical protein [Capsulimonas corticalis]BDI33935.1 hypothetical protein CCAX7_59860 [Capsulimonas corticalis]